MKNIVAIIIVVFSSLAFTACGGGNGDNVSLSRADEGIWSNLNNGIDYAGIEMQVVILGDGLYWAIHGSQTASLFSPDGVSHGTASVNGSAVSGVFTDFNSPAGGSIFNGVYSGTVSPQNNLDLEFSPFLAGSNGGQYSLSYDAIYSHPVSLTAISGSYSGYQIIDFSVPPNPAPINYERMPYNLTISGSSLTLQDQGGSVLMAGTVTPRGTNANVFDVTLAVTDVGTNAYIYLFGTAQSPEQWLPTGTVFNGILFVTSSGILQNVLEIVATSGNNAYFYMGNKN